MKIEVGQIYEVITEGFVTSYNKDTRRTGLLVGEKIEIRYPYDWHFRTEDNKYYHCAPSMIKDHCKLVGIIYDEVRRGNRAELSDILRLHLYNEPPRNAQHEANRKN